MPRTRDQEEHLRPTPTRSEDGEPAVAQREHRQDDDELDEDLFEDDVEEINLDDLEAMEGPDA